MTTFNPGCPQPPDIPSDSQDDFLTNFQLLNQFFSQDHVAFGNVVQNATNANPCVCTSQNHGLTSGNTVRIVHFASLIGDVIQLWNINGGPYTVTVIDPNTFSINADATANPPYLANSGAFSCAQFNYGFHKKITLPNTVGQGPNTVPPLGNPYSAIYSKDISNLAQLFFQNGVGSSFEKLMTQLDVQSVNNANGKGIVTPWGLKINFGQIAVKPTTVIYDLPIPFTSTFFSVVGTLFNAPKNTVYNMSAVGLTQFQAIQFNTNPLSQTKSIPAWYLAIGV